MLIFPVRGSTSQEMCNHCPQTLTQLFKSELDALHKQYGFPGATAAYLLPDGTIDVVATGFDDIECKILMTPESRMLAASIGKSFVGATILALAKEGRLNLDDLVSKWLGNFIWFSHVPNHSTITLRHLLTHSAGLPDHIHLKSFLQSMSQNWYKPGNLFPPEKLIGFILDQPALFEPGKGYAYTDTGYILLGLVIEVVTGCSFYEEVEQRFLRPLCLNMTSPSDRRSLCGLASGYTTVDNAFGFPCKTTFAPGIMAYNPAFEWTGGGFVSNSLDLALWAKFLFEGCAIHADYLNDLLQSVPIEEGLRYGAGVSINEKGPMGLRVLGHGGIIPGYSSSMRYYPKYRVAIAYQINTDMGIADHSTQLAQDMERRLAEIVISQIKK